MPLFCMRYKIQKESHYSSDVGGGGEEGGGGTLDPFQF